MGTCVPRMLEKRSGCGEGYDRGGCGAWVRHRGQCGLRGCNVRGASAERVRACTVYRAMRPGVRERIIGRERRRRAAQSLTRWPALSERSHQTEASAYQPESRITDRGAHPKMLQARAHPRTRTPLTGQNVYRGVTELQRIEGRLESFELKEREGGHLTREGGRRTRTAHAARVL